MEENEEDHGIDIPEELQDEWPLGIYLDRDSYDESIHVARDGYTGAQVVTGSSVDEVREKLKALIETKMKEVM
jgi:hypothetical protein